VLKPLLLTAASVLPTFAAAKSPADVLLLAGGSLPLCSSINRDACIGEAPLGRRSAPETLETDARGARLLETVNFAASRDSDAKAIYLHFVTMAQAAHLKRSGKPIKRPLIGIITASAQDPFDPVDFYLAAFSQAGADPLWLPLDGAVREAWSSGSKDLPRLRESLTGADDRSELYPDLAEFQRQFLLDRAQLASMIAEFDGLFFNGGDQMLTKAAWFDGAQPIPELALLKARVSAGTLAIGGTSAGTAVMGTAPMITNGESVTALKRGAKAQAPPPLDCAELGTCPPGLREDDLTYDPSGGLGLFPLGILDTHFDARDRQGRLAKLLLDSGTRYGFGVDETTALLLAPTANGYRLRALGAGEVWIFDAKKHSDAADLAGRARRLKPNEDLQWPR